MNVCKTDARFPQPVAQWAVWRIDDNGNTFVVQEHLEREEADRLVAEFTARGHKQMYWVARMTFPAAQNQGVDVGPDQS